MTRSILMFGTVVCFGCVLLGCNQGKTRDEAANLPRARPTYVRDQPDSPDKVYVVPANIADPIHTVDPTQESVVGSYTVDAMIGQINGRPMYASQIVRRIGEDTLATLGKQYPRQEFRKRAGFILGQTLSQMVQDALVLAEAEASLTEQEQQGLFGALQKIREDIISQYRGVEVEAEQGLAEYGGIEGKLEIERQKILVNKYRQEKVFPSIAVTRREIERYYDNHYDEYNPPANIKIGVLIAQNDVALSDVEKILANGGSFEEAGEIEGARYSELDVQGTLAEFKDLVSDDINAKVRKLKRIGDATDRTKTRAGYMWAQLLQLERGEGVALSEVYLEIENRIRLQKFNQVNRKHLKALMNKGNFTPIEDMLDVLLDVAMNRYAQSE